jgi:hypothetical protein
MRATITDEDRARLAKQPAWVRQIVDSLLYENRELRKLVLDGPADSDTEMTGNPGIPGRPLAKGARICFADFYHVRYGDVGSGARALLVQADGAIAIRPSASNSVIITRA